MKVFPNGKRTLILVHSALRSAHSANKKPSPVGVAFLDAVPSVAMHREGDSSRRGSSGQWNRKAKKATDGKGSGGGSEGRRIGGVGQPTNLRGTVEPITLSFTVCDRLGSPVSTDTKPGLGLVRYMLGKWEKQTLCQLPRATENQRSVFRSHLGSSCSVNDPS